MKQRIKIYSLRFTKWIEKNIKNILIILSIHLIVLFIFTLPYFNILGTSLAFIPYVLDIVLILILFKPSKELILKAALFLFVLDLLLIILPISNLLEIFANISYFLLWTYIVLSLYEIIRSEHNE